MSIASLLINSATEPVIDIWSSPLSATPQLAHKFQAFSQSFAQLDALPDSIQALCLARVAQLHRLTIASTTKTAALDEKLRKLERWNSEAEFDAAERACLAFSEVYCMDAHAISDDLAAGVTEQLGDAGLVALVQALGLFYASVRMHKIHGAPADE